MKSTTLILASLMMLGTTAAWAEGGAERMRYYYETLRLSQQANQQQPAPQVRVPDDQTAQMTEHYKP
ncbi:MULTISPECIES: hypothetical protein [Pseudomonas]|jgi:hypothetical protein|uniref:DUF4124 domain-containing protein n=1 Tax=Pseudomonas gregormendelii TaxID=1628277 RepID=A0ABS3AMK5_9PSED|nr:MULTISPECIES: hypothetical protein [Pseudomonas]KJH75116.1 hypothetical protein UB23_20390 [Pseudomonas sp. ES3-33]MBK5517868.1 hypothetical protein [Pseudomonas sp. TH10]MBN3968190.1 hypothetical protein [Pseudomonas gregormendelii]MCA4963752.1 hypothetical protein [Pseudomonas sp. Y24-6]MCH4876321.1 hypothetical protein [Pseudomonas sp. TMW22090]